MQVNEMEALIECYVAVANKHLKNYDPASAKYYFKQADEIRAMLPKPEAERLTPLPYVISSFKTGGMIFVKTEDQETAKKAYDILKPYATRATIKHSAFGKEITTEVTLSELYSFDAVVKSLRAQL